MDTLLHIEDIEEVRDRRIGIISSAASILGLCLILIFSQFAINPPLPIDTPPLNSDEVIEVFEIDNLEVVEEEAGGSGGGTPTNDRVDVPKPQSEKIVTQKTNTNNKVFSGNSNNQNSQNNSTNSSSTTQKAKNPFGDGGDGGGSGGGSGGRFGNDQGTGNGPGGNGSGSGSGRTRLNDPSVDHIQTNVNVTVYLKLTINENGEVVSASSTSKTTTTDQRIINQVKSAVINQVKYNKDPGAGLVTVYLTVRVNAT